MSRASSDLSFQAVYSRIHDGRFASEIWCTKELFEKTINCGRRLHQILLSHRYSHSLKTEFLTLISAQDGDFTSLLQSPSKNFVRSRWNLFILHAPSTAEEMSSTLPNSHTRKLPSHDFLKASCLGILSGSTRAAHAGGDNWIYGACTHWKLRGALVLVILPSANDFYASLSCAFYDSQVSRNSQPEPPAYLPSSCSPPWFRCYCW